MIRRKKTGQKLLENIWLFIFALLSSLSLWFFIAYKGQTETTVEASIEFKDMPKGVEILKQNIKKVNLHIRGPERQIKNLRPADLKVFVDLSNAKYGEAVYYFDKHNVELPSVVKVLKIEPNHVKIFLDESVSKVLPVKALVVGSPEKGYVIQSIKVTPETVTIEGPKSEVSKIRILKTEPVEVSGIDSVVSVHAKVNPNGKIVRIDPPEVLVTINPARSKR